MTVVSTPSALLGFPRNVYGWLARAILYSACVRLEKSGSLYQLRLQYNIGLHARQL